MKRILVLIVAVAALALAPTALASGVVCAHSSTCNSASLGASAAPPSAPSGGSGTLPFTGLDLAGVAAIAGLLVAGGLALRAWPSRRDANDAK